MAKTKYKEFVDLMIKNNQEIFDQFKTLHDQYGLNPDELQEKFNKEGAKVVRIVREWEDKLCRRSEGSGYGSYSGNLAEKFQSEVRKIFPQIDAVGIIVFSIKKITPK